MFGRQPLPSCSSLSSCGLHLWPTRPTTLTGAGGTPSQLGCACRRAASQNRMASRGAACRSVVPTTSSCQSNTPTAAAPRQRGPTWSIRSSRCASVWGRFSRRSRTRKSSNISETARHLRRRTRAHGTASRRRANSPGAPPSAPTSTSPVRGLLRSNRSSWARCHPRRSVVRLRPRCARCAWSLKRSTTRSTRAMAPSSSASGAVVRWTRPSKSGTRRKTARPAQVPTTRLRMVQ
mmetsp:Transcript_24946/g.63527  ORF Transcript_24946/g.63527 Transcript_24946/m.63527 type:complete len:235 (-) Transcript_24946:1365-2069(-)